MKLTGLLFLLAFFTVYTGTRAQVFVDADSSGVFNLKCNINGFRINACLDTCAARSLLSKEVADIMLKNGYLAESDIKGMETVKAGTELRECPVVHIGSVKIGFWSVGELEAAVVPDLPVHLVISGDAASAWGNVRIEKGRMALYRDPYLEYAGLDSLEGDALENMLGAVTLDLERCLDDGDYGKAAALYGLLYEKKRLSEFGILRYASCLNSNGNYDRAVELLDRISYWEEENGDRENSYSYFSELQRGYMGLGEYDRSVEAGERALLCCNRFSMPYYDTVVLICKAFADAGEGCRATAFAGGKAAEYLDMMGLEAADCWDKSYRDEMLAGLYMLVLTSEFSERNAVISAAWGDPEAIRICREKGYDYLKKPDYDY